MWQMIFFKRGSEYFSKLKFHKKTPANYINLQEFFSLMIEDI
ncbi:MAG: hypothetical protein ACJAW3_000525 [Lentimonas sp.]|jgi:hypothetical protein